MPWIFNEDAALKFKLQGLTVVDANAPNGRNVPVRYRLPETEVSDLTFPIIVISHNGWPIANDREHRGHIQVPYAPEGFDTWWDDSGGPAVAEFDPNDSPYYGDFPVPYNFDYKVELYCRFMHQHTLPLVAALAQSDRLHPKFGFLDIPQDGTKRTMQLLAGPSITESHYTDSDQPSDNKRFFIVTYLVRVFSELVPSILQPALTTSVNIDFSVYADTTDLTGPALAESAGILSVGANAAWNVSQRGN